MYFLLRVTDVSEQGGSLMPGRERRIYIKMDWGKKGRLFCPANRSELYVHLVTLVMSSTNHSLNLYS